MKKESGGIEWLLWNINNFCGIQLRQIFLWQQNTFVFNWDFSQLIKCLLKVDKFWWILVRSGFFKTF
jgi:hypothetical protein